MTTRQEIKSTPLSAIVEAGQEDTKYLLALKGLAEAASSACIELYSKADKNHGLKQQADEFNANVNIPLNSLLKGKGLVTIKEGVSTPVEAASVRKGLVQLRDELQQQNPSGSDTTDKNSAFSKLAKAIHATEADPSFWDRLAAHAQAKSTARNA